MITNETKKNKENFKTKIFLVLSIYILIQIMYLLWNLDVVAMTMHVLLLFACIYVDKYYWLISYNLNIVNYFA
jgi:hypothetical protein